MCRLAAGGCQGFCGWALVNGAALNTHVRALAWTWALAFLGSRQERHCQDAALPCLSSWSTKPPGTLHPPPSSGQPEAPLGTGRRSGSLLRELRPGHGGSWLDLPSDQQ